MELVMTQPQVKRVHPKRYTRIRNPKPFRVTKDGDWSDGDILEVLKLFTRYQYLTPSEAVLLLGPRKHRIHPRTLERTGPRAMKLETLKEWGVAKKVYNDEGQVVALELEKPRNWRAVSQLFQRMFEHGLLTRPPKQHDALWSPGEIIHALGNAGADILAELNLMPRGKTNYQSKSRSVGQLHLEHTRLVSRVRMALNLILPTDSSAFEDTKDWIPEGHKLRMEVMLPGEEEPVVVIPDAAFRLHRKPQADAETPEPQGFLLEVVRNNTEKKRFMPRLRAYVEGYEDLLGRLNELFEDNFVRLRVLMLCPTERRRDSIISMVRELEDEAGQALLPPPATKNND
jgi:hypothetical protein